MIEAAQNLYKKEIILTLLQIAFQILNEWLNMKNRCKLKISRKTDNEDQMSLAPKDNNGYTSMLSTQDVDALSN